MRKTTIPKQNLGELKTPGYFARITRQRGGGFLVEFPDLPGCLTEGDNLEDALAHAREALSGWLFVAIKNGDDIPEPEVYRGRSYYEIIPELDVAVPLLLLMARCRRGLTQKDVAKVLGITQQAYRKFEIPGLSNPTVRTLGRLSRVFDTRFMIRAA